MSVGSNGFLGMDVMARGYFGCPAPAPGMPFPSEPQRDPWTAWLIALDAAKRGDFTLMPRVLDLYDPAGDYRLNFQVMQLLGDAGPSSCFGPIVAELTEPTNPIDYEVAIDYAHAVANRGRLGDTPALLAAFKRHRDVPDASIIWVLIGEIVEHAPGELPDPDEVEDFANYEEAVLATYSDLIRTHGPDALFFRGEIVCVRRIAERLLEALQQPYFAASWRHKFEAFTGIDCSAFYKRGNLQPLAAAALVEEFLDSGEAEKFEAGLRYFFAHRVPD